VCSLPLSEVAYENNELDLAAQLVDEAMPSAREYGFVDQLLSAFLIRARICHARRDLDGALQTLDEAMAIAVERDLQRLRFALVSERVRVLIESGRQEEAIRHAEAHGIDITHRAALPGENFTTVEEYRAIIWVRLALASDRLFEAMGVVRQWRSFCAGRGAVRAQIRWNILLARVHYTGGNKLAALRALREALTQGASSRALRSFIDEGGTIRAMLESIEPAEVRASHPTDAFAEELLAIFSGPDGRTRTVQADSLGEEGLYGRFNQREREILTLVASGLRNREIAERMGMTEGTIKWYLQQVFDKIGARRRAHAVVRARQFGLIAS
jgi:LuxR family maltose regulon positive regulatory protein